MTLNGKEYGDIWDTSRTIHRDRAKYEHQHPLVVLSMVKSLVFKDTLEEHHPVPNEEHNDP